MIPYITTFLTLMSGIVAVISAFSSYKSSSIAKQALNFQENVILRKNEISSISSLIKSLQTLNLLTNVNPLNMPDDEFDAIPSLIQIIKDNVLSLKSTGYGALASKITDWEETDYESTSIGNLMIHPNETVFTKISESPDTLKASIEGLIGIYKELLTE